MLKFTSKPCEDKDPIGSLLKMLEKEVLDPKFEDFGNFVYVITPELLYRKTGEDDHLIGLTRFFGNFLTYSHVFCFTTDEPDIIESVTAAIQANKMKPEYIAALDALRKDQLEKSWLKYSRKE